MNRVETHPPAIAFGALWIWRPLPAWLAYPLAMGMGVALFLWIYTLAFFGAESAFFTTNDPAQHVSGWWFFKDDAWRFPLLLTERFNAPAGASIAFTDSIPLWALLFKPFAQWLPADFHYFSYWHAFTYVMQACAAVYLLRALNLAHLPALIAGCFFALTWPAFTFRFGHAALTGHGLLLLALAFYLKGHYQRWSREKTLGALLGLSLLSFLVHPYLWAMVTPFFGVYLLKLYLTKTLALKQLAQWLAGYAGLLLLVLYAGGYFIGQGALLGGFGTYSLNLLGPVCGGMLCPLVDATGGQYEGFNYFGAGFLGLLLWVLVSQYRHLWAMLKKHWLLALLFIGFSLYALSNRVFIGHVELLRLPLPSVFDALVGVFRVGGRFFWPVGYAILFAVLVLLLRKRSLWMLLGLAAAIGLQWHDTHGRRDTVQVEALKTNELPIAAWQSLTQDRKHLMVYPAFGCAQPRHDHQVVAFQYLAARLGLTMSSAYVARKTQSCAQAEAFVQQPPSADALYMFTNYEQWPFLPPFFQTLLQSGDCALASPNLLCAPGINPAHWQPLATPSTELRAPYWQWQAGDMNSQIGHLVNEQMVPRTSGAIGYLTFGPDMHLPVGDYRFALNYQSGAATEQTVGFWEVVAVDDQGQLSVLATSPLQGSAHTPQQQHLQVSVPHYFKSVAIRVFSQGQDLAVSATDIALLTP